MVLPAPSLYLFFLPQLINLYYLCYHAHFSSTPLYLMLHLHQPLPSITQLLKVHNLPFHLNENLFPVITERYLQNSDYYTATEHKWWLCPNVTFFNTTTTLTTMTMHINPSLAAWAQVISHCVFTLFCFRPSVYICWVSILWRSCTDSPHSTPRAE